MSSFFNTDDAIVEYNASEPANDWNRWLDQFVHLMGIPAATRGQGHRRPRRRRTARHADLDPINPGVPKRPGLRGRCHRLRLACLTRATVHRRASRRTPTRSRPLRALDSSPAATRGLQRTSFIEAGRVSEGRRGDMLRVPGSFGCVTFLFTEVGGVGKTRLGARRRGSMLRGPSRPDEVLRFSSGRSAPIRLAVPTPGARVRAGPRRAPAVDAAVAAERNWNRRSGWSWHREAELLRATVPSGVESGCTLMAAGRRSDPVGRLGCAVCSAERT